MPASTLDPVNAALRTALSKNTSDNNLDSQLAGSTKKALLSTIEFEPAGSYQSTVLDKLKSKYIVLKSAEPQQTSKQDNMGADESLSIAKHELFSIQAVQLGWNNSDWAVGAGMVNMGNTCYLNSTLQALFHVPALVNWLISDKQHMVECEDSGGYCIICAMRKTLQDSQQRNTNSIRPFLIYNKLRLVCRNLIPGRQEDAHEFLRYLVEAMEKSYLNRFKNNTQFDSRTKETTPLNQILGGYLRSAVRCLDCGHISTTFQHFQDVLVDIRKAQTIDEALEGYFSRESLEDGSYHCEACQKKVPATKQFYLERAPMVLCIQLKRFSVTNNKITKHIQFKQRLELTRYSIQRPNVPLIYRLVALVTHMGPTVGCGHYTAVAQAPCGNFYQFDDSMVRPISHQAVFTTNAYIMLYELERAQFAAKASTANGTSTLNKNGTSTLNKIQINGNTSSKIYGPELPPSKLLKLEDQNGTVSSTLNGKHTISSTVSSPSTSTSSESEPEKILKSPQKETAKQPPGTPTKINSESPKKGSPIKNSVQSTVKSPLTPKIIRNNGTLNRSSSSTSVSSLSSKDSPQESTIVSSSTQVTKLVPYDDDESDSSSNEAPKISTKAASSDWNVTSSTDDIPSEGKSCDKRKNTNDRGTVNELLKMSHGGYAAPVSSWNGNRAQLDKEISNERREDRKRANSDDGSDQGRLKHPKTSSSSSNGNFKSNPGYNPIQEFHNSKNWTGNNSSYRQFYNTGSKHRNGGRRNFHHKSNYHNKNYRFRQ